MSESKVVGFFHSKGLVPAWNLAKKFAKEGGRIATLPDIIEAKLNSKPGNIAWENWFTTNTAEYYGLGKDGRKKFIVAHGVGPMSTLDGALKAYSHEYKDKSRNNRGGRISQQEFWNLESGKYGSVEILDFDGVIEDFTLNGIDYPFSEILDLEQCLLNRLLKARLGPKAEEFIKLHSKITSEWLEDEKSEFIFDPGIIQMNNAQNCGYMYYPLEEGLAFGHLISIGRLTNVIPYGKHSSLVTDIGCHEWGDGTKFIGIQKDAKMDKIDKCIDDHNLLKKNWKQLMLPVESPVYLGLVKRIITYNDQEFTEYPKDGDRMDTGEPEFLVLSKEPIGEPIDFKTTTGGTNWFFRYGIKEISILAPPESNSYIFIEEIGTIYIDNTPSFHTNKIQFYRAQIDYSHRLIRASQLANDYDKMIELIDK